MILLNAQVITSFTSRDITQTPARQTRPLLGFWGSRKIGGVSVTLHDGTKVLARPVAMGDVIDLTMWLIYYYTVSKYWNLKIKFYPSHFEVTT